MASAPSRVNFLDFVSRSVYRGISCLREKGGSFTWSPTVALARRTILSKLSSIEVGTLQIVDGTRGEHHTFGQSLGGDGGDGGDGDNSDIASSIDKNEPEIRNGRPGDSDGPQPKRSAHHPHATLVVRGEAFWVRLALFADMGFAEAYMLGEVECPDLTAFFRLFILNRDRLGDGTTRTAAVTGAIAGLARSANTLSNALLNASAHYDISNDVFAAFLSADMTYSCPVWKAREGTTARAGASEAGADASGAAEESLEEAQMAKLRRIIALAHIKPTDHVLEIGTGWGSFAIQAAKQTGCRVTTLTLSREQKAWAESQIAAEGQSGRIEVLLMDYRALPEPATPYDKVVSIEMLEAVGKDYLGTYFARVDRLLKRDGGIAVFQCITMPEGRHEAYSRREDFVNHYIFPGGYLPSTTQLLNHITAESNGTLVVEQVENIGGHYARALRLWRERFVANFHTRIRPALTTQHPGMQDEEVDVFRRKWEYYFAYCEAGFATKTLGDVIITVGREGARELMEGIPL